MRKPSQFFYSFVLDFPAGIAPSSLSVQWVLCSGSFSRQARLRTSRIISWDQPDINHLSLTHTQVITFYMTLHANQNAVISCRRAHKRERHRYRERIRETKLDMDMQDLNSKEIMNVS